MIGHSKVESYVIHDGAQCKQIADDLEQAYPEINHGQMVDCNWALVISFTGFTKNVTSRRKSKGSMRPGEFHGKNNQWPDEPALRSQLEGAMRLASKARMFRTVSVSCSANGQTWSIDTNKALPGYDNGRTLGGFTRIALQAFQAYGIPVFPCTGALQA